MFYLSIIIFIDTKFVCVDHKKKKIKKILVKSKNKKKKKLYEI